MHYYQHHIGDYRRDTAHLSLLEHGIYRQLLDWAYLETDPVPKETEKVFRRLSARTDEERAAVLLVLDEFFTLTETGYVQSRVEREKREYETKAERARNAGKLGGRPKKTEEVISGLSKQTEAKANHKPLTNNQSIPPLPPDGGIRQSADGVRVRGMRLPEGWGRDDSDETGLTEEVRGVARALKTGLASDWNGATVRYHFDEFEAHFRACSGRNAVKVDWLAAWRKWCSQAMREMPGRDPVRRDRLMASRRDEVRFAA